MFKALRSCDEVQVYPVQSETVKELGTRIRSILMANYFTGIDRWQVRIGVRSVFVKRIGPR